MTGVIDGLHHQGDLGKQKTRRRTGGFQKGRDSLLHQKHLPSALDRDAELALEGGRQAGVLPGQNPSVVGHVLLEQGDVLVVNRVDGVVHFGTFAGRAGRIPAL